MIIILLCGEPATAKILLLIDKVYIAIQSQICNKIPLINVPDCVAVVEVFCIGNDVKIFIENSIASERNLVPRNALFD
jgi:hypothetical protein